MRVNAGMHRVGRPKKRERKKTRKTVFLLSNHRQFPGITGYRESVQEEQPSPRVASPCSRRFRVPRSLDQVYARCFFHPFLLFYALSVPFRNYDTTVDASYYTSRTLSTIFPSRWEGELRLYVEEYLG